MNFQAQPSPLIDDRGQVALGVFPETVSRINGREADYRTPMGSRANPLARHFHYKQFQYFGIISDELLAGCALAHTAWLGMAFFYIFEPRTGTLREYTWRSPLGRDLHMSDSPRDGISRFRQKGVDIELGYQDNGQQLIKTLQVTLDDLQLQATMEEGPDYQPMSLCTRTGVNGWVYANKVAGKAVTGTLIRQGQETCLAELDACGHHDFSAGYMRRETFWNWACLSTVAGGKRIGLNLSCGVNETTFSENCLWVDDVMIPTDGVMFDYQRDDLMQPWQIRSLCGRVELTFTPSGNHRERLNLGLFASNFNQLFGRFDGHLRLDDGSRIAITSRYGFVEEQYAKW
ncbi:MAG: DUF2804 domain-containing protein [Pseudomonadota bacterium]|uniref:DUF2804 domain-containing protein n=1 Tax=Alcanivorax sp. TaxID=1872427 RepID=UPI00243D8A75|nr:DUF2804 domain-containing protein [Alcanivorax sp.]MED5238905.1 DUF2804 domain-containing protein [Pseudomonadota bacterium]MEE3320038.1 DUF2804 domain-containing protein [Pseudomonadota bacterium]